MSENEQYEAAISFADGLIRMGMKLGLSTIREVLAELGNPHDTLRIVHVAGTNGKGSVCAMVAAAAQAAGLRVGLFTSPHLVSVRERLRIDGKAIDKHAFATLTGEIRARCGAYFDGSKGYTPTYFEFMTALGFLWFAREKVDLAVIEVGLGGRLDSTNVVAPAVTAITSIDLEHTQYLGTTLAEIAGEKGGIIKPGVPVVIGERKPEALDRLLAIAAERQAPSLCLGRDFEVLGYEQACGADGRWEQRNRLRWRHEALEIVTQLVGHHQAANLAVAWVTLAALRELGLALDPEAMRRGLASATWPARLQVLPDGLILDSAHNPAGMEVSVASLEQLLPGVRFDIILGVLAEKQWQRSLEQLVRITRSLRVVRVNNARSADPRQVRDYVKQRWPELPVKVCRSVDTALAQVRRQDRGLVIGSIYFVGEILERYYHGEPVEL